MLLHYNFAKNNAVLSQEEAKLFHAKYVKYDVYMKYSRIK